MFKENDKINMGGQLGIIQKLDPTYMLVRFNNGRLEIFNRDGSCIEDKSFEGEYWENLECPGFFFKILEIETKSDIYTDLKLRWYSISRGDLHREETIRVYKNKYREWIPLRRKLNYVQRKADY
jgi:hypothetical protein